MNSDRNLESSNPASTPTSPSVPRILWAAIAVLAVAVIAMGGVLLKQSAGDAARMATPAATTATANLASLQPAPDDGIRPPLPVAPPSATAAPGPAGSAPSASRVPMLVGAAPQAAPSVAFAAAPPAPPLCTVCGHVESVRTVQSEQPTSGVGAVAGGVVGGVVGNQIGHGGGRTAATVLGAVGGGFLGNHIERRTHTLTRYEVTVRMDDGSRRTVETRSAPPVGKDVTLKGQVLQPANRHL
ncbi:outer membrane lipoprotein SlyB [Variovorax sp. GrIS 2.14]|uniref:glycine zipper 2TM domain-containing protein n=1 Tax=Variovorax sp. GrIS 2.14 TaxID=3071709 RepID=UPI0038F62386